MALLPKDVMDQLTRLYQSLKRDIHSGLDDCTFIYDTVGDAMGDGLCDEGEEALEALRYQADEFRTNFEGARDGLRELRLALNNAGLSIKEDD